MSVVNVLLDKTKLTLGFKSDKELADYLHVSRQLVSQWRNGANPVPDERVTMFSRLCDDTPEHWLVMIRAEQSKGGAQEAWARLAKKLGAVAMTLALGVGLASPRDVQAAAGGFDATPSIHYAK